jgi:hypothetical protein
VKLLQVQIVTQQQFGTVDQLQHHEIANLNRTRFPVGENPFGEAFAPVAKHADDFLEA